MAKKWTNLNLPGALHFVTGNVFNRRRIFRIAENCKSFLKELQALRNEGDCKLVAFVIMLDHFHLILNPRDGDIQKHIGILKSFTAKSLVQLAPDGFYLRGEQNQVWQESFKALPLWSGWMISQKTNYIHANPVKAGLSKSAKDYPWTSFRGFYGEEADPLLQIDREWWWPDDIEKLNTAMAELQSGYDEKFEAWREAKINRNNP